MNVAVYGGSFDPPHLGHVMVPTHLLLNDPNIDRIIVMPCFQQTGKNLTSFWARYKMCRIAFEWLPRVKVSNLEQTLGGESLTLRTMQHLKRDNPTWNLRFVVGSDLLLRTATWEGWDELCAIAPPLVIGRAGITPPPGVQEATPISPIVSSTIVRGELAKPDYGDAERYLPSGVLDYIKGMQLYTPNAVHAPDHESV